MPHCVIEHFPDLSTVKDRAETMQLALSVCAASNVMAAADVKVRCIASDAIHFGDGRASFIHITLSMLAGRTDEQKIHVAERLREAFRERHPDIESISVDIRDMNPSCYRKSLI